MAKTSKPTFIMLALAFLGVVIGVFARQPIMELFQEKPAPPPTPPTIKLPPTPEEVAKPHLTWADQDGQTGCRRAERRLKTEWPTIGNDGRRRRAHENWTDGRIA